MRREEREGKGRKAGEPQLGVQETPELPALASLLTLCTSV